MPILRILPVEKDEILSGDIKSAEILVAQSFSDLANRGRIWPWMMTVSGYDDDPRELSEIPEVKAWFRKVQKAFPYLPIFLAEFSLNQYLISQLEFEVYSKDESGTDYAVDETQLKTLFTEISIAAIEILSEKGIGKQGRVQFLDEAFARIYSSLNNS